MLTVDRKKLLAALDTVVRVAPSRDTMPVLSTVHLTPRTDGTLAIACTDLYTAITAVVAYEGESDGSPCAANAKMFVDRAKRLPNGHARLAWTAPKASDAHVRLTVADGPRSYELRALPDNEIPPIPTADSARVVVTLAASTLARAIDRVLHAVCLDETRPAMNAVLVEVSGAVLRMVATDGHRLSLHEETVTGASDATMLVSLSAMRHVRHMLAAKRCTAEASVTVSVDDKRVNAFVSIDGVGTLATRIVQGTFPPYEQVIPARAGMARHVTVDRKALLGALAAVKVASSERTGSVVLTMHAYAIDLHAEDGDGNKADERVSACRITKEASDAAAFKVGVNAAYLIDACEAVSSETVCLSTSGPVDPILVTTNVDTTIAVVMPMRI